MRATGNRVDGVVASASARCRARPVARKLRFEFEGAVYHVLNRGNYRRALFETDGAAASFERCLDETAVRHEWRVHAFVIMRNHFHLALETPKPNLSVGMKYLQGTWANRFNRYRGQTGRPFQGRFKALHVEPGHALAQVANYIHLNPVRAKVVTIETPASFRWSSLRWYLQPKRPPWLMAETLLAEAGSLVDTPADWKRYVAYLGVLAEDSPGEREEKYGNMAKGWVVGTKEYRVSLIQQMRDAQLCLQRASHLGDEAGDRRRFREELWRERLDAIAAMANIKLDELGHRKSDAQKVFLAALMKATTDVSNQWLSAHLRMGTPASAGEFIRRFGLRGGTQDPRFQAVLLRVETRPLR